MASIWQKIRKQKTDQPDERLSLDQWAGEMMKYQNNFYPLGGSLMRQGSKQEVLGNDFSAYVAGAYKSNGPIFACCMARMTVFSEIRFVWQKLTDTSGRPGDLVGGELEILERPWPNGNTSDLLSRAIQDVDLCGNHYVVSEGVGTARRLRRLRPDWVDIVLTAPPSEAVGSDVEGYIYKPGGTENPEQWVMYPADGSNGAIAHWAPIPDPDAMYRGMSWITPILRELMGDKAATEHKLKFFENAAPQPLDAKVLTPYGWATMGDMEIGSEIIGSDGQAHRVIGVYPQGEQDIYRVTFNDGTSAESTLDHVWRVSNSYDRKLGRSRTMTLREIMDTVAHDCGTNRWSVANVEAVEYVDQGELPLDPYVLGVLLGDGCFGGRSVSCASHDDDVEELRESFRAALPDSVRISVRSREGSGSELQFSRVNGTERENWLKRQVRDLGLDKVLHAEKSVPESYMRASVKDRLAVLQGLIDSDGSVKGASVRFTSTSQVLANQVAELAMSLGGNATVTPVESKNQWTVIVRRLPDWAIPCRLSRKVASYRQPVRVGAYRTIASVEHSRRAEAQCIRVDVPDHMYVTDDMILTHNTPNLAVSLKETVTPEQFKEFMTSMNESKHGIEHAYETLYLGGGADVKVIGVDLKQMDFRSMQGLSETRIASAARVPATIAGFSEGLQGSSLNQGNFQSAKDQFGDATLRPLWRSLCSAYEELLPKHTDKRLWYDDREIPFLRQDRKEVAEIQASQSRAIGYLIMQGFTPDSIVESVMKEDYTLLEHTGLYSVQLIPPGSAAPAGTGQTKHNDPKVQEGKPDANKSGQTSKDKPDKTGADAKGTQK